MDQVYLCEKHILSISIFFWCFLSMFFDVFFVGIWPGGIWKDWWKWLTWQYFRCFFFPFLCWLFLTVTEKNIFLRYILSQDEHYFISFILDKVLVVNNKRNQLKIKGIMLVKMVIVSFFWGGTRQLVIERVIFSAYHLRRDLDTWNLNLHFLTKHLSGKNEIL